MNSSTIISLSIVGLSLAALMGCTSGDGSSPAPDGSSSSNECTAAGGQCVIGDVICAVPGSQSCPNGGGATPAGIFCCLSDVADCGQPNVTTYECPASSDGGAACKGSAPVPFGAPNYEALVEAGDDDASYAVGCKVTFPACSSGQVPYCTCIVQAEPTWSCVY